MRTLILMRHAKSSWDNPRHTDHERPLNGRGRAGAAKIGHWLQAQGYMPDAVVLSDSARTMETLARLGSAFLGLPTDPRRDLYHASPQLMLGAIRMQTAPCVLMIGHNPGIAALAESLAYRPPDHPRFHDYPTAATTVLRFNGDDWSAVEKGDVLAFQIPRDL